MAQILSQADARKVRDLSFCYICGYSFSSEEETNYDHLPPSAIFAVADRDFPLKLRTHKWGCHSSLNLDDEIMSQLFALAHGKYPYPKTDMMNLSSYEHIDGGKIITIFDEKNIELLLRRWIQGFHAALYGTSLAANSSWAIQGPFPSAGMTDYGLIVEPIKMQHYEFVKCIKRNRLAGNIDRVVTNNGKLKYECVWDLLSDGSPGCVFALNLYDWAGLGDTENFEKRGCAGLYRPASLELPSNASVSTSLVFEASNEAPTDPFGN
jgi:hypothetical protein